MVPNADTAQQIGYAGVMLEGTSLHFFHGLWSEEMRGRKINIAVLEAWSVAMTAATWGAMFEGRKVVFRTDSEASCNCLNKLWSGSLEMQAVCDLWEDLQHRFGFEGLVLFCPGVENRLSDKASRCKSRDKVAAKLREELTMMEMSHVEVQEWDVRWECGDVRVDITEFLLR